MDNSLLAVRGINHKYIVVGGIGLEKDSALYQLMDTHMHSVMNGIVSSDGEYQAILRKSDIYGHLLSISNPCSEKNFRSLDNTFLLWSESVRGFCFFISA